MIKLSVIIPSSDSPATVQKFLPGILAAIEDCDTTEVILVDAWDRESKRNYVESLGVKYVFAGKARRSFQSNFGAKAATGILLFFLHIDSKPPRGFDAIISASANDGFESGSFKLKFASSSRFLAAFAWFTKFKWSIARGGDQGLFVKRAVFDEVGGYKNAWQIMEDVDLARKLIKRKTFAILRPALVTSARKYERVGIIKLQFLFTVITILYWMGISNKTIYRFYLKYVEERKDVPPVQV
ncbi:glycosyltransferase family 2 protein [Cryomorpha ignava]|uniref:Glycosyltransferase family 2 protein n=1 Tax=Cryomorpha ignava TaxID=101383 RepID=A0A7K3WQX7_9FLAO|nr:glycosyltransferase family 2 protein [Cryomorpha ignava]NEN23926.1 glycosyltransferase family 2 protein [Cryomorpha ignava]